MIYQREHNPEAQKHFIVSVATYYYLVGTFMALGLSLLAKEVIRLMASQPEFWGAWVIVPIIAFSYLQHGLCFTQFYLLLEDRKILSTKGRRLRPAGVNPSRPVRHAVHLVGGVLVQFLRCNGFVFIQIRFAL